MKRTRDKSKNGAWLVTIDYVLAVSMNSVSIKIPFADIKLDREQ